MKSCLASRASGDVTITSGFGMSILATRGSAFLNRVARLNERSFATFWGHRSLYLLLHRLDSLSEILIYRIENYQISVSPIHLGRLGATTSAYALSMP